jgi:hypothetical protein
LQFELFIGFPAGARGSWVIGANVQSKLFVTPQLKVPHHFIEGIAISRARRVEDPGALGAAKTSKMLFLNPLQLPIHGDCIAPPLCLTACLIPACVSVSLHLRIFFAAGMECTCAYLDGLSGVLHTIKIVFVRRADFGAWFELADSFCVIVQGRVLKRSVLLSIRVASQGTVERSSTGASRTPGILPVSHSMTGEFNPASVRVSVPILVD